MTTKSADSARKPVVASIITHTVTAGGEAEYELWLRDILEVIRHFPGYLGREIFRPAYGKRTYTTILRFDAPEHLEAWLASAERKGFIERAQHLLARGDVYEIKTGVDFWFTPESMKPPRRWKQFLLTVTAVYPLTLILPQVLAPVFALAPGFWNPYFQGLAVAMMLTGLLTFVIMPQVTKLARRWLFEEDD